MRGEVTQQVQISERDEDRVLNTSSVLAHL
jgi:hypothetical protein